MLHENFAEFLESVGDVKQAAAQWRQVQELMPHSCEPFYQAGRLLAELGQWDEAQAGVDKGRDVASASGGRLVVNWAVFISALENLIWPCRITTVRGSWIRRTRLIVLYAGKAFRN